MEYYYNGYRILQHPDIQPEFEKIINDFDRIIELGTYNGGLTLFLHDLLPKDKKVDLISYDIDVSLRDVPDMEGIDFRYCNYFEEMYINEIAHLISDTDKRVLLICDGGYKEYEFNHFSQYLKSGDVIMVHDYAETFAEWELHTKPIGWESREDSWYPVLKEGSIDKYGLSPHKHYIEFKRVLWGIFQKD